MIELRLLGSLELKKSDGKEVTSVLVQPKRAALLCYLAIGRARGFHRRDSLVALFWPDLDQTRARAALRQALHFLRRTLGGDVVVRRGSEEVGIDDSKVRCDVTEFENALGCGSLEHAVGLYGGELLLGHGLSDTPEFERWLETERTRVARLYATALEALAKRAAQEGDQRSAVEWGRRLAEETPFSPTAALMLMEALDAVGDAVGALSHAKCYSHLLRVELGVEPDPRVEAMAARLRSRSSVPTAAPGPASSHASPTGIPPRRRRRLIAALGSVALLVLAVQVLGRPVGEIDQNSYEPTIAVLPFRTLDAETPTYLAAGLSDGVAWRAAGVGGVVVLGGPHLGAPQPSVRPARPDADYLLGAHVHRLGRPDAVDSLTVVPVLTRVADQTVVWTDTLRGDMSSVFDLLGRITERLVEVVGARPSRAERAWLYRESTRSVEAYDAFLRGTDYLARARPGRQLLEQAVRFFERAVALDPSFVHAHSRLSTAHVLLYAFGHDVSERRVALAKASADEAIRLRPDLPQAHMAQAWYHYFGTSNYGRAARHFELIRSTWSGIPDVPLLLGGLLRRQGDFDGAAAAYEEGVHGRPSCMTCAVEVAATRLLQHDYERARDAVYRALGTNQDSLYTRLVAAVWSISAEQDVVTARSLLALAPDHAMLPYSGTGWLAPLSRIVGGRFNDALLRHPSEFVIDSSRVDLAIAELADRTGDVDLAGRHFRSAMIRLLASCDHPLAGAIHHSRLAIAYAGLGMREEAIDAASRAVRDRPVSLDALEGPQVLANQARVYTMLGERDAAVDVLKRVLAVPSGISQALLRLDPIWGPLRGYPPFEELISNPAISTVETDATD